MKVFNKLEPPQEKKGRVTPVTGIKPITTLRFKMAWIKIPMDKPKDRNFKKRLFWFKEIFTDR